MKTDHITNNPDFQNWLILLDATASARGITIPLIHFDGVIGIWCLRRGNDIEKDVDHYEDFARRLTALSAPGGDWHKDYNEIMCGECWLNTGSPECKCLTNNPK